MAFWYLLIGLVAAGLGLIISRALFCKPAKALIFESVNLKIEEDSAIEHLCRVIQFETISEQPLVNANPEAFKALHTYLFSTYPDLFKQVELKSFGEFALLLKWQGEDSSMEPMLLIAHQDVVPVPISESDQWSFPPFSGQVDDGYIYGRGALDMKSSLVAILEALNHLMQDGFKPQRSIYIYLGDDEEVGGPTAKKAAEWLEAEKVSLSYIIDEGGAILEKLIPKFELPLCLIGIGQKGQLNIELSVKGDSGHSAKPPKHTPIDILGGAIAKIKEQEMPIQKDSLVFPLFQKMAPYLPFTQKLIIANLWLFKPLLAAKLTANPLMNAMMRTTAAPTIFQAGIKQNILPEIATAIINYRLYPGTTSDEVLKHLQMVLQNLPVKIKVLDNFNGPVLADPKAYGFDIICKTACQISKAPLLSAPVLTIGGTDGRHFKALTDNAYQFLFIRGTMEDFKGYHGINERISVSNYLNSIRFYIQLIKNSQNHQEFKECPRPY
ncbi:zinc metalloprotein [Legionella nautarum]|uniref:Zinc metalloprotein n=1 Tax=Legionella nautarum TaxID=45070 RepID=A0A0W0WYT2_9GAMM|nr:M20/M25/M40 family metallo-hydrolase [Legionella nautarum]KTD37468.1 zinc metalloprotein [Legionella nautarum]